MRHMCLLYFAGVKSVVGDNPIVGTQGHTESTFALHVVANSAHGSKLKETLI